MFKQCELTVDQILVVEGRNPRLALSGIEDLAESIIQNGVMTPIKVELKTDPDGKKVYELIDGHRRFAACAHLHKDKQIKVKIPALVINGLHGEADVLVQMMVANDSVQFEPIEEATMFRRLQDEFSLTLDDIAKQVGKSMAYVSDRMALLRAHPVLKEAVVDGAITTSDANTIIRKSRGDTTQQKELAERVLEEGREKVIDKELKRGRMPKAAWDLAASVYDNVWQAAMAMQLEDGVNFLGPLLQSENIVVDVTKLLSESSNKEAGTELAFYLGQLQAFANFSNLSATEMWNKIAERGNY